jgi:outer membrane lipoprotein-sorting protein
MFKNIFIILLLFVAYVYVVSSDYEKAIPSKIKAYYQDVIDYLDDMDIEVHMNKWPSKHEK